MEGFHWGLLTGCIAGALIVIFVMATNCGIGEGACQKARQTLCKVPLDIRPDIPYH